MYDGRAKVLEYLSSNDRRELYLVKVMHIDEDSTDTRREQKSPFSQFKDYVAQILLKIQIVKENTSLHLNISMKRHLYTTILVNKETLMEK